MSPRLIAAGAQNRIDDYNGARKTISIWKVSRPVPWKRTPLILVKKTCIGVNIYTTQQSLRITVENGYMVRFRIRLRYVKLYTSHCLQCVGIHRDHTQVTHLAHAYFFFIFIMLSLGYRCVAKNPWNIENQVVSILCYYCRYKQISFGVYLTMDDRSYVRENNYDFIYLQQTKIKADFQYFMVFLQHICSPRRAW